MKEFPSSLALLKCCFLPSFLSLTAHASKKEVTTMSDTHFHNDHNTTAAIMTAPVSEWEGFTKAIIYK
jgi:hypothetical protein